MLRKGRFKIRKETVLFALDLVACSGSMWLALLIRFAGQPPAWHLIPYLSFLPLIMLIRIGAASAMRLYDFRYRLTITDHFFGATGAAFLGVAASYAILAAVQLYLLDQAELSRLVALLDLLVTLTWFATSRAVTLSILKKSGYRVRIGLVGSSPASRRLGEEIRLRAPALVELAGTISIGTTETDADTREEEHLLGGWEDLDDVVSRAGIDLLILTQGDMTQQWLGNFLAQCDSCFVEAYLYPDLDISVLAHSSVVSISGIPLVSLTPLRAKTGYRTGKRIADIIVATLALLLSSPVAALIALALKLESRGPVFFSQERVGLRNHRFTIHKFRTMKEGAESTDGPTLATKNDPRVTRVGRWLRRSRMDEMPQFWNILVGDMSLVGPRPERPLYVEHFTRENPLYGRRTLVRPGLTGLAQIFGSYDTDYQIKLRYDLIYINGMSFSKDLRILIATIQTVITGRGAT